MKKFLMTVIPGVLFLFLLDWLYFGLGVLYLPSRQAPAYFAKAEGESLYLDQGSGYGEWEVRGVNLGLGKPGHYATSLAVTKDEYLRWFGQIKAMGANVIRTYTLAGPDFYEAFYEFNRENPDPLYLFHGVWVDDYLINSSFSALDEEFSEPFFRDCKKVVDVVHGRHKEREENSLFSRFYRWDISPWVCGYILGVEWEGTLVTYTDKSFPQQEQLDGGYFYTEGASNFEIFLASAGEEMVAYETEKYGAQRMIAFSNWPTTDPLAYPQNLTEYFLKSAQIDVEHIRCKEAFGPGQFASYHMYPYYPDYYSFLPVHEENTYLQYLRDINEHHAMPVVISEFGVPSSRGMAAREDSLGRNQGNLSETQQGEALVSMYRDIRAAGSAGGIVFTWQDEWFKRTWNTMANVDLTATPYWSDYQTNEQYFGLLSFDPGEEESACYPDGDKSEWTEGDLVSEQDGVRLSMRYDERYLYFLVEQEGFDLQADKLYIPIDTTPKSGSSRAGNLGVEMDREADFVVELDGRDNSRIWVQEYYDGIEALFYDKITPWDLFSQTFPERDTDTFVKIRLLIQKDLYFVRDSLEDQNYLDDKSIPYAEYDQRNPMHYSRMENYETGKLAYGNGNPNRPDFHSLADFCAGDGFVELRLPWQLLNVADPSRMNIHDDYYAHYGVEYLHIEHLYAGAGDGTGRIAMEPFALEPLGRRPEFHERLKVSYYMLRALWTEYPAA
ncbi:MAG: hypothetical protein HFF97_00205 [Oscillibacter sp.]|jgi:hypothetical protein|uniref:hypothetical protein n=1 Tax=uncultured Oscillibacter sp. TaxID=876091 RepID=UPI0021731DB6|nr:hypothetical protein [uncultured Oscillibacter sp.]MCI9643143.1 hypothetical protein [Oscillibacter sp.]